MPKCGRVIAELKYQLFGPKADKLNPEQAEQLRQLTGDQHEQAQRPAPAQRQLFFTISDN